MCYTSPFITKQSQASLAAVYRIDKPINIRIKVEDDLLKELSIFDAERAENGTKTTFMKIANIDENVEETAHPVTLPKFKSLNSTETSNVNTNRSKLIEIKSNKTGENGKWKYCCE